MMVFFLLTRQRIFFVITSAFSTNCYTTESSYVKYFFSQTYGDLFKYCYDFAKEKRQIVFSQEEKIDLMQIKGGKYKKVRKITDEK